MRLPGIFLSCAAFFVAGQLWAQQVATIRPHGAPDAVTAEWSVAGPSPITTGAGPISGRITSLAIDPADASGGTILFGTSGGGAWRATANTSTALTDFVTDFASGAHVASLAVGAASAQPGNTGVLLAGTGEPGYSAAAHYGQGLLRSINSGQTWSVIDSTVFGDNGKQFFIGEAFSGFAWSSVSTGQVVAALASSGDGARTGALTLGASVRGLYVSSDAGSTWNLSAINDTAADGSTQPVQNSDTNFSNYDGNSAFAVVWNAARQMYFAAVSGHGLYASPDGVTFTRLATQPAPFEVCPTDPGYAADTRCPFWFASLAVEPASGDMYVWFADISGVDQGLWVDRCAAASGACAAPAAFATQLTQGGADDGQAQGSAVLAVAAAQGTHLLLGARQLSGCTVTVGSSSCSLINQSAGACASGVAGQFRALVANAGGEVSAGTSEGLWQAPDAACVTGNFSNLNGIVGAISPAIAVAANPSSVGDALAGFDGLGAAGTASRTTAWPQLTEGDSGVTAIDSADGDWYAQDGAGVSIARCAGGDSCASGGFQDVIGDAQVSGDASLEYPPFLLDPASPQQLLLGTCRVWRGPANGSADLTAISPDFDGSNGTCTTADAFVDALSAGGPAVDGVSSVVYAGMAGPAPGESEFALAVAGNIFVSRNAADAQPEWKDVASSAVTNGSGVTSVFNPGGYDLSAVAIDPHDPSGATVYAAVRGFGVANIYRSTNAGASWTDISANLPDVPANGVAVDPNDAQTVYLALDTGVYVTRSVSNCGNTECWQAYGGGLPTTQAYAITATGGKTSLLRVALNGRGVWKIPLATTTSTNTTYTVTPLSLTFPATQVSTSSAPESFTITNTGGLSLTTGSASVTGDFTAAGDCVTATVAPGESCTVQVVFSPSAQGMQTGSVTLGANVSGGQIGPLLLTGQGASPPQIELSPSGTLSFGEVVLGTTSSDGDVLVANIGTANATLTSFTASGDFSVDSAHTTCGATLAAQNGCTVAVQFTPSARGVLNGTLTVVDSAGTQTLALTGTGVAPANLTASPASLTFPSTVIGSASAPQTVTVMNSGDVYADLTGVVATGDFSAVSSCGTVLPGGGSCTVAVTFLPTQPGLRTGTLVISDPFQTLTISLSGTGTGTAPLTLSPASLDFGSASIGQTVGPLTMTLTNTGSVAVTILDISTATETAGTNDYAVTSNCTALAPGASCTISITFTPSISGPDPGTLTIEGSNAGDLITASLNGNGSTLAFVSGQSPAAAVPAGQIATYAVAIADDGYQGGVAFTCIGLPTGASCQPPTGITLPGSGEFSATVGVATGTAVRGSYSFTLRMAGGSSTASLTMSLTVK